MLGALALAGAFVLPAGPTMAAGAGAAYTCTGGDIPTGNYRSITATGVCDVPADAVINVVGNLNVAAGAVLDAQSAPSTITVGRNVTGTDTMVVLLNGVTVKGNVTLSGGGSEEIPWSIKNNTVGRNLSVSGITDEWLGVMFNQIGGNANLSNITLHDVDPGAPGVYVVENHVARNLNCSGLVPGVSGGFIPGEVNHVGGRANGQCAPLV